MSGEAILLNGGGCDEEEHPAPQHPRLSHIPEDRHKHGLVLDYNLAYNLVLQQYFEPRFQSGRFLKTTRFTGMRMS